MKVAEILVIIKQSANLNEEEYQEVEKSYYEIVNLKMVKLLGESLTPEQQNIFITDLKNIKDGTPLDQVAQMLKKFGVDPDTARGFIDLSAKQAFKEIIKVLESRIQKTANKELTKIIA